MPVLGYKEILNCTWYTRVQPRGTLVAPSIVYFKFSAGHREEFWVNAGGPFALRSGCLRINLASQVARGYCDPRDPGAGRIQDRLSNSEWTLPCHLSSLLCETRRRNANVGLVSPGVPYSRRLWVRVGLWSLILRGHSIISEMVSNMPTYRLTVWKDK